MLIRHLRPGSHRDLEVSWGPRATVGHLAAALEPHRTTRGPDRALWVDGRRVPPHRPLASSGLAAGSAVSLQAVPAGGGFGSTAGGPADRTIAGPAGTIPRHRTGRPPLPEPAPPVKLPEPPPSTPPVTPIGVVAMAFSMAGAGAMVALLGSWTYAAFGAVGPLMVVGNALDSRFRRRRGRKRYRRHLSQELERVRCELAAAAAAERSLRAATFPGAAAAVATALSHEPTCWERRPPDEDAYCARVGIGAAPHSPQLAGDLDAAPPEVGAVVADFSDLSGTALGTELAPGRPLAVVGPPAAARGLARSLVLQLVASHGPADLALAAVVGADARTEWDWLAWLPHSTGPDGGRNVVVSGPTAEALTARVGAPGGGRLLVVLDDGAGMQARRSAARTLLRSSLDPANRTACLVVACTGEPVPAACSTVLRVDVDGSLSGPPEMVSGPAVVDTLDLEAATHAARRLSRFDDPEAGEGQALPAEVDLGPLLGLHRCAPEAIAQRWEASGPDPVPEAVIGVSCEGPVSVDLVADGPHVLVVGTTGSGKSEALRTLVLSLASTQSPEHLVFVLVDFKGGSAFDACDALPHTVGLVTDLDDQLADRALRCLEAELRHRERLLREHGATDLAAFRRAAPPGAVLPRLIVVVDELAVLSTAVPSFVDALVDLAQRGRSLGIHLVLATQRPAGALTPSLRANIALRVVLRLQSPDDSRDLLGSERAATLPRHIPGRALLSFGPHDVMAVQVATCDRPGPDRETRITVRDLGLLDASEPDPDAPRSVSGPSDLVAMVQAIASAWSGLDRPAPRRPWPDPLPDALHWPVPPSVAGAATSERADRRGLVLGLADEPDRQRVVPFGWDLDAGPLLAVGLPGSGTVHVASTSVLAACARWDASECHIHVVDAVGSALVPLAGLPQVGAVITACEVERQRRLIETLHAELERRRAGPTAAQRLLVVHGAASLRPRWEEVGLDGCWAMLVDLVAGGSRHGIHVCCTVDGGPVPHQLLSACSQRLAFRLGDATDLAGLGFPSRASIDLPDGRAWSMSGAGGPLLVQIARPPDGLAAAVARLTGATGRSSGPEPPWVGVIPVLLRSSELTLTASATGGGALSLPVGIADRGLVTATLDLPPGAHALVSGPPRSGRSTTIESLARAAAGVDGLRVVLVSAADVRSVPAGVEVVGPDSSALSALPEHSGPLLVLVDDADTAPDDHPTLAALASQRQPQRHVVASGRNDRLRSRFAHWTREIRADGIGILLQPDLDLDGDLVGARLPRRAPVPLVPGRAWLTGPGAGSGGFVQIAVPSAPPNP